MRQYQSLYERYNTPAYQGRITEMIRLVKARGFRPSQLGEEASEAQAVQAEAVEAADKRGIQP